MGVAQGAGNKPIGGGGLGGVHAHSRIYCFIQPLLYDASGAPLPDPGTIDAHGNYLHIRYEGNFNLGGRSSQTVTDLDFVPNTITVEFDAMSEFSVPFEGSITLVGGTGQYKWGLQVYDVVDKQFYRPELRTLMTYMTAGSTFTVPDFHTYILGTNLSDTFTLPTRTTLQPSLNLPGSSVVLPGQQLGVDKDTTVLTGWRG